MKENMRATITKVSCQTTGDAGIYLYQVDYTDKPAPCKNNEWLTFGVYEQKVVADYVKKQIETGGIRPPKQQNNL